MKQRYMLDTCICGYISEKGVSIGPNDTAIAGHSISARCILVTNNTREFKRGSGLHWED